MQNAGRAAGHTPQEVAVCLAAHLPVIHRALLRDDVVEKWIVTGKIDHKSEEMCAALSELSLSDLLVLP